MDIDRKIISKMHELNANGKSVIFILKFVIDSIGLEERSRPRAIFYFKEAFSLKLRDAAQIGAWEYFDNANWTDEMIEKAIGPLIGNLHQD